MSTGPETAQQPAPPGRRAAPLLEVVVLGPADVAGARDGGADRLLLLVDPAHGGRSPEPALVAAVRRAGDLPVRVLLRLNEGLTTTGGELTRLLGLGGDYLHLGADGLAFGFLDADLEVDTELCTTVASAFPGVPWTFHAAFDQCLSTDRAWRMVRTLPGLDAVVSSGSARGLPEGFDDLIDRAAGNAEVAHLLLPGGGLQPEHVPWLVRAGVSQFQLGPEVRPDGTWTKAYVDPGYVRSWRLLLDHAAEQSAGAAGRSSA